ncbi:MAG: phosphoribosylanthranilate isomerase, partial [Microvirga sp.]|nr:phosphoribosylanthranilate isomerase [Microvirga sp.]
MDRLIKICGLSTPETLDAALASGADLVGFVRFAKSPRHVDRDTGRALSRQAKGRAQRVVLLVDADDTAIADAIEALDPDMLQLHGAETPTRVADIRGRFGRPVLKAIGVADAGDLAIAAGYAGIADHLLLDAKPPRTGDALPGGNGLPFDWTLLAGLDPALAFMLSGGLDAANVATAIRLARPN